MKKITNTILFAGSMFLGYHLGGCAVKTNTETKNYEIVKTKNEYALHSKELNKDHVLRNRNKETYMGGLEHLTNGVKKMYEQRGKKYE